MTRTLSFVAAPPGETFFYRKRVTATCNGVLQVIQTADENKHRFRKLSGPFLYAVTDAQGNMRYLGKSLESSLYKRWERIRGNIHHKESRDYIIAELAAGRGPLSLWCASIDELRPRIPVQFQSLDARQIARNLEGLWIQRWKHELWNDKYEAFDGTFSDGEYWAYTLL